MEPQNEIVPVEVFSGTTLQAEMVKSLLGNAEIEAYVIDNFMGTLNPWWTSAGGAAPVRVFVASGDAEHAREVVKDYLRSINEPTN